MRNSLHSDLGEPKNDRPRERKESALPHLDSAEVERQRHRAESFELLSAVACVETSDALLRELAAVFAHAGRVDVAVIRLREGERLWSRATVGLEEEIAAGFSINVVDCGAVDFPNDAPVVSPVTEDAIGRSPFMREKGVRRLYRLPLVVDRALIGDVHLGNLDDRELSDMDRELVGAIGGRAAAVLSRIAVVEGLRDAVRARDEVLSTVAHDLRNPIGVIALGAATLLQRLTDTSARLGVERILRGAHRADRLVRDLLEISAIETGNITVECRRVEPADLILSAIESQQSLTAEASVIIATDLSPELPPIEADDERLLEVLENLVGNAIKFTSAGGTITVGATTQNDEVLVWVKDSGAGIAPDQLPHVFDRFWQARKASRRGTGLGLTICKGIVEAHGGRIWAESTVGVGTTMFFTIPAIPPRTTEPEESAVANLLLVDDRPENLLSLEAILERPDYRLVTATTGEEALGLALRETFSVALIDIAMPKMSGLEVAVHLKELERSRDIPIIFVTAFGDDPQEIHRAYEAGGADYLVKPLDAEIVRKKVAVFVDLSRKRLGAGDTGTARRKHRV